MAIFILFELFFGTHCTPDESKYWGNSSLIVLTKKKRLKTYFSLDAVLLIILQNTWLFKKN